VEAMAAGKPVVCFDSAGPGFHVDEKCGIKINPEIQNRRLRAYRRHWKKLYLDKNLRDKLGKEPGKKRKGNTAGISWEKN